MKTRTPRSPDQQIPSVGELRDKHHTLAKLVAQEVPLVEAALATGYNTLHASVLESDAAFNELVTFYRTGKGPRTMKTGRGSHKERTTNVEPE